MKEFILSILLILQYSAVLSQPAWQLQSPFPTLYRMESSFFFDANTGYAAGEYGTIIFTSNGGEEWQLQESGIDNILYSVYFTSAMKGWCAGSGVIINTTNGGIDWNTQFTDNNAYLLPSGIYFYRLEAGNYAGTKRMILLKQRHLSCDIFQMIECKIRYFIKHPEG